MQTDTQQPVSEDRPSVVQESLPSPVTDASMEVFREAMYVSCSRCPLPAGWFKSPDELVEIFKTPEHAFVRGEL